MFGCHSYSLVAEKSGIAMKLSGFDHKISVGVSVIRLYNYYGFTVVVV